MRKVLKNSDCFHFWAHQIQSEGRNGTYSVSFNGPVLFSYDQPIGMIHNGVTLLHTGKFSITTSDHQSCARQAAQGRCLSVPHIARYTHDSDLRSMHEAVREQWEDDIVAAHKCIANPRMKKTRLRRINGLARLTENWRAYSEHFGLGWPAQVIPEDIERQRAEAEHKALEEARLQDEKARRDEAEALAEWRQGAQLRQRFCTCAVRISGETVQTSMGAEFPAEHAKKLWPLLCRWKREGKRYQRNGHTVHLGVYAVDSFDGVTGTLRAGCHTVEWGELEHAADLLGLSPYVEFYEEETV